MNVAPRHYKLHVRPASRPRLGKAEYRTGRKPITTHGCLRGAARAWVYVGVSAKGRVKIGMSGSPERRCADLHIRMVHAIEVVPPAAKEVETTALRILGKRQHEGEWVPSTAAAIEAVNQAFDLVKRSRWADPAEGEDEARLNRVATLMAVSR